MGKRTQFPDLDIKNNDQAILGLYDQMFGVVDIIEVLQKAANVVQHSVDAERATIYLALNDTSELASVAKIGNIAHTIEIPIDHHSLAGHCALTRSSFVIPDAYGGFKWY